MTLDAPDRRKPDATVVDATGWGASKLSRQTLATDTSTARSAIDTLREANQ